MQSCCDLNVTLESYLRYKAHRDILLSKLHRRVVVEMSSRHQRLWQQLVEGLCGATEKLFVLLSRALAGFLKDNFAEVRRMIPELSDRTDLEIEALVIFHDGFDDKMVGVRLQRDTEFTEELRSAAEEYVTTRTDLVANIYYFLIISGLERSYMFDFVRDSMPYVNGPPETWSRNLAILPDMEDVEQSLLGHNFELRPATADTIAAKMSMMTGTVHVAGPRAIGLSYANGYSVPVYPSPD